MKLKCRSGDGCSEPTFQTRLFCERHSLQLDEIAQRISGSASGAGADRVHGRWAVALACAVWAGTPTAKLPKVIDTAVSHPGYRKALKIAEGNGWLSKPAGRGWERGATKPPGFDPAATPPPAEKPKTDAVTRLPRRVRIERLRALVAERGEVPKADAAKAIGVSSAGGSFLHILRAAVADGSVISGTGVVKPGPAIAQAA